jgi:hypothetical protein
MTSVYMSSEKKGIYFVERHPKLCLLEGFVTETNLIIVNCLAMYGIGSKIKVCFINKSVHSYIFY